MTENEWKNRMESDKYNELKITDCNSNRPYVFVSYKSDAWDIVLTKIVYTLWKEYKLRVYFDKSFNSNNNIWTEQFPENMNDPNCKAVLAFVDNKYFTSYATLMEIMNSQTYSAVGGNEKGMPIVPVNLQELVELTADEQTMDTGLGKGTYSDGTKNIKNVNAQTEKDFFDELFEELKDRKILKKAQYMYKGKELTKQVCSIMMEELFQYAKASENPYKENLEPSAFYEPLVGTIKSVAPDVFDEKPEHEKSEQRPVEKEEHQVDWKQFDRIRAFSINGDRYNVSDAKQAYIAIVDVLKQKGVEFDASEIVEGKKPEFVLLGDGSELDMVNGGYGNILKMVDAIKNSGILLYDIAQEGAMECKTYEIVQREDEKPKPSMSVQEEETMRETVHEFSKTFNKMCKDLGTGGEAQKRLQDVKVILPEGCCDRPVIEWNGYLKDIPKQMLETLHDFTNGRFTEYIHKNLTGRLSGSKALMLVEDLSELDEEGRSGGESKSLWKPMENAGYFVYQAYVPKDAIRAIQHVYDQYTAYMKDNGSDEYANRTVYIEYCLQL